MYQRSALKYLHRALYMRQGHGLHVDQSKAAKSVAIELSLLSNMFLLGVKFVA